MCSVNLLENLNDNKIITGYNGVHISYKNETDVKAIYIYKTNTYHIPANLGILFNLTSFVVHESNLIEIRSNDFNGMQDLEQLSVNKNRLTFLPMDAFTRLTKLKNLNLNKNLIEEIPNDLFSNNLNLETVDVRSNKIKYIGSAVFYGLAKLKVYLDDNICMDNNYEESSAIIQLKEDIRANYIHPNDSIDLKINKMIKSNLESVQHIKDLINHELMAIKEENQMMKMQMNELMIQLLNAIDIQHKDRMIINKLRTELSSYNISFLEQLLKKSNEHQMERTFNNKKVTDLSLVTDALTENE